MEAFVNDVCKAYFGEHSHVTDLGPTATYLRFVRLAEHRDVAVDSAQLRYTFARGRIEYRVGHGHIRTTGQLLLKYCEWRPPADADDHFAAFNRETTFLRRLLPALQPAHACAPKLCASRLAHSDACGRAAALFEWPHGALDFGCRRLIGEPRLSLMVRRIAQLHVAYWRAPLSADLWPPADRHHLPYAQPQQVVPLLRRCLEALDRAADPQAEQRLRRTLDEFAERLRAPFEPPPAAYRRCWTLCHQCYGQQSVFFEEGGQTPSRVRLLNWQSMGFASLGVDLAIALFVEQKCHRRRVVPRLIVAYWQALAELPVAQRPTLEAICDEIRRCVPVALYVLACRVRKACSAALGDNYLYPTECWNEATVVSLYKYLMRTRFV